MKLHALCILASISAICSPSSAVPTPSSAAEPDPQSFKNWQEMMKHVPLPPHAASGGCFAAEYPESQYREVPCGDPKLVPPMSGSSSPSQASKRKKDAPGKTSLGDSAKDDGVPLEASAGTAASDYEANVYYTSTGNFSAATGSFLKFVGAPTTKYSLQLNSNAWNFSAFCGPNLGRVCTARQQFVFQPEYGLFLQYWLIAYGKSCPSGWTASAHQNCYRTGAPTVGIILPNDKLKSASLNAVTSGGGNLTLTFSDYKGVYVSEGPDYLGLGVPMKIGGSNPPLGWQRAEFNIFGDTNGDKVLFPANSQVSVEVDTVLSNGGFATQCASGTETGETSNLKLGKNCNVLAEGISFTESN